jgi:hypothetical protein
MTTRMRCRQNGQELLQDLISSVPWFCGLGTWRANGKIAVANGEVIDVDDNARASISRADLLRLEVGCMQYGNPQFSLNFSSQLRIFRGNLRREELMTARQTSLSNFLDIIRVLADTFLSHIWQRSHYVTLCHVLGVAYVS